MSVFKPFCGLRPIAALAASIASRPYDVMNREEAKEEAAGNSHSFLHIIRAEIDLPDSVGDYDQTVYDKAKENFAQWITDNIFVQDPSPNFYIYEQEWLGYKQTGIMGLISTDDYLNDMIKKHEFTRPAKELDRINHMKTTGLHAEPILTAYPAVKEIDEIVAALVQQQEPDYNFIAPDGIRHTLWAITQPALNQTLQQLFDQKVPAIYIADGHHRAASSVKVALHCRQNNPNHTGYEDYNFILAVAFPDNQLRIIDYNRVIKDLNGLDVAHFLDKISPNFDVQKKTGLYKPEKPRQFSMYLDGQWYCLTAKPHLYQNTDIIESLDISILSNGLIDPVLGIKDQRTDSRIDFVGGMRGLEELQRRTDSGEMRLAFALYPVSMAQLIAVADSGNVMPPKSTWFEPKLRSGLVVHKF